MEKEKVGFEKILSSMMVLSQSSDIDYNSLNQMMEKFFNRCNDKEKYELVDEPLRYLIHFVDEGDECFKIKEGFQFNIDISQTIQWNRSCTLEEYLIIVSGKNVFNDMYEILSETKENELSMEDNERDQYVKRLIKFYGGK